MTLTRSPLAAEPVESLLRRVGTLQGASELAAPRVVPQSTASFTERMKDVQCIVEVEQTRIATANTRRASPS